MLAAAGYEVVTYDIADGRPYPRDKVAECAFAVICVGTPEGEDGKADLSGVWNAVSQVPKRVPLLIRSTMPPGSTAQIPGDIVCHAPEFMHERKGGAWSESSDVPFLILGGKPEARAYFLPHLMGIFPKIHECDARTAEMVKYVINLHLAARVTFINEMDRICQAVGANWEDVREAWLMDPRITPEYTGGIAEFGPGFGGRCWPKDLAALIASSREAGYDPAFLLAIQENNARFRS